jgi:hypothetical protein
VVQAHRPPVSGHYRPQYLYRSKAFDTNPNDDSLLIGSEEVTNERTVHLNAIGITKAIQAQRGSSVTEILQNTHDSIRAQDAIPLINHPNFRWAFTASEIASIASQVRRIQSRNDAAHIVSRVFSSSFEAKFFKTETCMDVGEKLYRAWRQSSY